MIRYCTRCVMPETKPDLFIDDEGVCSACRHYERRWEVDWEARRQELVELLERHRSKAGSDYDCIVPASGGKDSTFQVLKIKELGFNPLCVNWATCHMSDIGRRNLDNLKRLGIDCIEVSGDPVVRRKLNRIGLCQIGDITWPEHVGIFTTPIRIAVRFGVPLVIWGENSQDEFGGPDATARSNVKTRRWVEEFGGLLGLRVSDLVGQDGIEARDLIPYTYPSEDELKRVGVTGLFLGYYIPWDGYNNALLAQGHGFETYPRCVEGTILNYENLDNLFHGIHDYFKFLKFGFGRATDHACLHIRRGRLTRADALALVKLHDGKFPWSYLGHPLDELLKEAEITFEEFVRVCDRFTNKRLFACDNRGQPIKDERGNLRKINQDNP